MSKYYRVAGMMKDDLIKKYEKCVAEMLDNIAMQKGAKKFKGVERDKFLTHSIGMIASNFGYDVKAIEQMYKDRGYEDGVNPKSIDEMIDDSYKKASYDDEYYDEREEAREEAIEEEIKATIKELERKNDYKGLMDYARIKYEDVFKHNEDFSIEEDLKYYMEDENLTREEKIEKLKNIEEFLKFFEGLYNDNDEFGEYVRNRIMEDDDNRAEALDAANDAYEYQRDPYAYYGVSRSDFM